MFCKSLNINNIFTGILPECSCLPDGHGVLLVGQEASHGQHGGEDAQGTEGKK